MKLIDRIIDDPLFYRWVFNPDVYTNRIWEDFMRENPDYADEIINLKNRLSQIQIVNKQLLQEEKEQLAHRILLETIDKTTQKKEMWHVKFLRYAAVILFAFGVGGVVSYFIFHDSERPIVLPEMNVLSQMSGPMLILPEGESVDLGEKESRIDYSNEGTILLNGSRVLKSGANTAPSKINQVVIPYGNRSEITLNDSTVVYLNAGSRLVYPSTFEGENREVYLFGEAFFDVAKDTKHPFVVHTSDISIRVLGTKFNISAYPEDNVIQTVLEEGEVSIRRKDAGLFERDIVLHPNELASYSRKDKNVRITEVDISYYTLWKDGVIKFSNSDLNRVLKHLERYYRVQFRFENPFNADIKISGKLSLKEKKEEVFEYISRVALIDIEYDKGNQYVIK